MLWCDAMLQLTRGPFQIQIKLIRSTELKFDLLSIDSFLQRPSGLGVSMALANRDFKYFYEDEVFRVTKKGSLQFGMVSVDG